jgi:hypothetical protein
MELDRPLSFVSEEGDAAFSIDDVSGAQPASVAAVDDQFFAAATDDPDSFEHEDTPLGTLHATAVVGHGGQAIWSLVFQFDDGSRITAVAWLPVKNGRPGAGLGNVTGGTGIYRGLAGELEVRAKNPNRWRIA